jgi:predicted ATPase
MITLIEALDYRCLRYVRQPLGTFQVLVGPNGSGKTTFLDVIAFLGRFVSEGLEAAITERTQNFADLVWGRSDAGHLELAVEAAIPKDRRDRLGGKEHTTVRYEVAIEADPGSGEVLVVGEKALLNAADPSSPRAQRELFPQASLPPEHIVGRAAPGSKTVVNKISGGNDNFYSETGKGWSTAFKLGPRKSALGNLPDDESKFPATTWLKGLLTDGVRQMMLNSMLIRKASPPGQTRGFKPDGSNLPWVIDTLERSDPDRFREWVSHLRTALPDLENIRTVQREDDKHRYMMVRYRDGIEVPSWVVSDGTLRLFALTLPAYLRDFTGVYLIEEPENGIHPTAVSTMYQSLSSVYDAQLLLATHSPVILSVADARQVLCFAKTPDGAVDIVPGSEHPALRDWRGEVNLSDLFAAGVLG